LDKYKILNKNLQTGLQAELLISTIMKNMEDQLWIYIYSLPYTIYYNR